MVSVCTLSYVAYFEVIIIRYTTTTITTTVNTTTTTLKDMLVLEVLSN